MTLNLARMNACPIEELPKLHSSHVPLPPCQLSVSKKKQNEKIKTEGESTSLTYKYVDIFA